MGLQARGQAAASNVECEYKIMRATKVLTGCLGGASLNHW